MRFHPTRPLPLTIAIGLIAALIIALVKGIPEAYAPLSVALTTALFKLTESDEKTSSHA